MMQIEVNHLVKEYKRKRDPGTLLKALGSMFRPDYEIFRAVDDINLGIEKGEAVGYVGPNGSHYHQDAFRRPYTDCRNDQDRWP